MLKGAQYINVMKAAAKSRIHNLEDRCLKVNCNFQPFKISILKKRINLVVFYGH